MSGSRSIPLSPSSAGGVEPARPDEFLKLEYEQLNEWARHGEEAAHRIFNFYVSLLTAVLGSFLVIAQVLNTSLQAVFLIGSGVCLLLVVIGVTFLDALVCQYIRNAHYRIGIELIRTHFRRDPEIAGSLTRPSRLTLEADAERASQFFDMKLESVRSKRIRRLGQWMLRPFRLLSPVSTQQIFISMMTSLLLGALVWSLVWGIAGIGTRPGGILLASAVVIVSSFISQNIFARTGLQNLFDRFRETLAADVTMSLDNHR
jgi:hypothetical protein